uniref:4-(cytidine 5'-diphospho)-2-C-methyl-D-erythritol kinase n=1 Tax=Herbidospora sakaeratensis TaxID=564415 RepID=UPI00078671ED
MTVRVPAKVNLQLSVGPIRDDGFHDLVNVFQAVSLFDEVTASESDRVEVVCDHADVPLGADNLAARAAHALAPGRGVRLEIKKTIPVAGGMAGGSADAAAALVACDALWNLGKTREELMEIGGTLGSDVPFALLGGTAVGTGKGEVLTPMEVSGVFHWVFALADGGLSTPQVYGECDRIREATGEHAAWPVLSDALTEALANGDAAALGPALVNDLQPAAIMLRRSLHRTLDEGRELGALGALVSGSGPTCAFLAADEMHARELAVALTSCREAVVASGPVPGAAIV